jgi:LPS O-antigen subunit length determinant protein (WzzB/FepE family)|tara:strand:- start:179 stop:1153 length:975 start_codon:yes stop_codon:yes gene_type:complete
MKKNIYIANEEIDLIDLFRIIFDGKIKIILITVVSFLIGFGYSYFTPNNYLISLDISKSSFFEFRNFNYVNQLITSNQLNDQKGSFDQNLTSRNMLNRFTDELQDYEEFLFNLKKSEKVKENLSHLPLEFQDKALLDYVKLFKIEKKNNNSDLILNFRWDNIDEATNILQETIDLTMKNLSDTIYEELYSILEHQIKKSITTDKLRIEFLKGQRWIAKELNISDFTASAENSYFLMGTKAIDKEIELIKNRNGPEFELIKTEIDILKKENINWISYDISSKKIKFLKNIKLILITSIMFGLVAGVFYVLISSSFPSKKNFKKRH